MSLFRRRPLAALAALAVILRGKAHFKRHVASQVEVDPAVLPYRQELLSELRELHQQGARLVLATASDLAYAQAVADHLQIFAEVVASDGATNVSGEVKASMLAARYGDQGFEYIGNDWADVPVWRRAGGATAVAASPRLVRYLAREAKPHRIVGARRHVLIALVRALRPHQWAKNALVFVPIVAGHNLLRLDLVAASLWTFVAFSLCASSIYILNDISDIQADRQHARKRRRPFAAGELGIPAGVAGAAALAAGAVAIAAFGVSWRLVVVLLVYVAATSAYTLWLKRVPVSDVFMLTGLYVLRIVAGGIATGTQLSSWLLAFALFIFLSLAFVKRYVELMATNAQLPGREYGPADALWMHAVGTSSGYMAVLILALYVTAPEVTVLYSRPQVLWMLCPVLLFWLTRLWFRAGRRLIHDDPVVEALKDPAGYATAAVAGVILIAATVL